MCGCQAVSKARICGCQVTVNNKTQDGDDGGVFQKRNGYKWIQIDTNGASMDFSVELVVFKLPPARA